MLRLQNYQRLKITGNYFKTLTTTTNLVHDNINDNDGILMDNFTKEYLKNKIELTSVQRFLLSTGSSIAALIDPYRHDMIACLGETTGHNELKEILYIMKNCTEGKKILNDKPRINTSTVSLDKLRDLPNTTFGYCYVKFLDDNNVTPDSRMNVQFLDDPELAYVMTRYRETHDLVHTILDMPTHMLGEVAVKWIEAINTKLPMCIGGAIFGAMRLRPKQRKLYVNHYLPWAIEAGKHMKPLLPVYWEKRWEQNIDDLRNELNITLLQLPK